jgi:hypothetical protein
MNRTTSRSDIAMSVLEIKQAISRLTTWERREIQIYLHQLKRTTPAWKKATAKKIADVQAGKFTTLEELEALHRR